MENDFKKELINKTLFIKTRGNDIFIVQINVNDVLFGAVNDSYNKEFSEVMSKAFEEYNGKIKSFPWITNPIREIYVRDILKNYNLNQLKLSKTLMNSLCSLDQDLDRKSVDQKNNRGIISLLLYLTPSRPDIMFSWCVCSVSN